MKTSIETVDLGSVVVSFEPPDLLRVSVKSDGRLELADAKRIKVFALSQASEGKFRMLSVPEDGATVAPEIREYLSSVERLAYVYADALVVRSFPHRLITDFYLKFHRPKVPTKIFATEEAARAWLETL